MKTQERTTLTRQDTSNIFLREYMRIHRINKIELVTECEQAQKYLLPNRYFVIVGDGGRIYDEFDGGRYDELNLLYFVGV